MIMWLWIIIFLMVMLCFLVMYIPDWDKRISRVFKTGAAGSPEAPSKSKLDRYKILKKSKGR